MKEEIPDDLTRAWLNGQLAPAEREKMERLLDSDPSLAAGMARRRAEMAVSELLIAAETRNLFREWRAESPQPLPGVKPAVWLAGIVAGFVLMAVAVWLVCFPPGAPALPAENPSPKLQPTPPASSAPIAAAPAEKPAATPAASINYRALATRYLPDPTFPSSGVRRWIPQPALIARRNGHSKPAITGVLSACWLKPIVRSNNRRHFYPLMPCFVCNASPKRKRSLPASWKGIAGNTGLPANGLC
ncbi:MAG: hypothetical protein IPH12_11990 [Saprospirales bacterium]|nr:hypothetical protein [Saprospirales bacterium]